MTFRHLARPGWWMSPHCRSRGPLDLQWMWGSKSDLKRQPIKFLLECLQRASCTCRENGAAVRKDWMRLIRWQLARFLSFNQLHFLCYARAHEVDCLFTMCHHFSHINFFAIRAGSVMYRCVRSKHTHELRKSVLGNCVGKFAVWILLLPEHLP